MGKLDELIQKYCPDGVEYIPIGKIGDIIRGKRFVHKDDVENGVPAIHYGELYTHYGVSATEVKTHIRNELKPKMRYAHNGDVIIVGAGENKTDIGVGVAWLGEDDVAVHDACFILTNHKQNPVYLSYCLRTVDYHRQLFPYVSEGKICSFLKDGLAEVEIPVPPLPVQEEIVRILDKFTELETGLETELELRREQNKFVYNSIYTEAYNSYPHKALSEVAKEERIKNKGQRITDAFSVTQKGIIRTSDYFGKKTNITSENTSGYCVVKPHWFAYSPSRINVGSFNYSEVSFDVIVSPLNKVFSVNEAVVDVDYLKYYLGTDKGFADALRFREGIEGTGRWHLDFSDMSTMIIPLPDIDTQKRIVEKVKCGFELIDELSTEIKMRHQQYEYYRDKLLTFKRLEDKAV